MQPKLRSLLCYTPYCKVQSSENTKLQSVLLKLCPFNILILEMSDGDCNYYCHQGTYSLGVSFKFANDGEEPWQLQKMSVSVSYD